MKAGSTEPGAGEAALWKRAEEITEFCVRRGAECFRGWPVRTLFAYVFFHAVDRTVFCVRAGSREQGAGHEMAAVLFAWGMPAADIQRRAAEGKAGFDWKRSADKSDALFLAEVIGRREFLPRLVKQAEARWPDWRRKRIFTFRAGRLVELPVDVIEKMVTLARPAVRV